jgi:hypothetical protein
MKGGAYRKGREALLHPGPARPDPYDLCAGVLIRLVGVRANDRERYLVQVVSTLRGISAPYWTTPRP